MQSADGLLGTLRPAESLGLVLFGSRARRDHRPGSDWDLALLLGPRVPKADHLRIQLAVTARATELLGGKVDVVILDDASPGLRYVVAREGRPVAMDSEEWAWFQARAASEYPDWRRFIEPFERAAREGLHALAHEGERDG